jgi:subtilisin family serine protease
VSRGIRIVAAAAALACALPAAASAATREDPFLFQQWPLARETALGRAAAWQQSTGAGAVVAILDTGADLSHPDLRGAFWTNPGEIAGNGLDDDHDGFVDDVHGADFVNHDGDPSDDEGHGTHVAGIVAARAGNGLGGAGLAPNASIMVVKVLDEHRAGTAAGLADGIRYAVDHGARIINTSVNGDGTSRPLQEAIRDAGAAGALVVASAGNDGRDIDADPSYPASYPDPSIVTVAATSATGMLASFSNRGPIAVDLAAPGENVLSTSADNGYELRSGTSMAAPFASATLALIESVRPDLEGSALKAALLAGARPTPVFSGLVGGGALDAAGALRAVLGSTNWHGSLAPLAVGALAAGAARHGAVLRWSLGGDTAAVAVLRISLDGRRAVRRSPVLPAALRVRVRPGPHRWRVVALDRGGERLGAAGGVFRVHGERRRAAARRHS